MGDYWARVERSLVGAGLSDSVQSVVVKVCVIDLFVLYAETVSGILKEEAHVRRHSAYGWMFDHCEPIDKIISVACDIPHRVFDRERRSSSEIVGVTGRYIDRRSEHPCGVSEVRMLVCCRVCRVSLLVGRVDH